MQARADRRPIPNLDPSVLAGQPAEQQSTLRRQYPSRNTRHGQKETAMGRDIILICSVPRLVDAATDNGGGEPYQFTKTFFNESSMDLTFTDRNNISVSIDRADSSKIRRGHERAVIRSAYHLRGNRSIRSFYSNIKHSKERLAYRNEDLEIIESIIDERLLHDQYLTMLTVMIDREVFIDNLSQFKAIYQKETDILITETCSALKIPHPHSEDYKVEDRIEDHTRGSRAAGILVEIIDNNRSIGERFIYAGKEIIPVPIYQDPTRPDGVHFVKLENDGSPLTSYQIQCYPIEEADEKLGLYKTREAAMAGGDIDTLHKTELKRLERENALLKAEQERNKLSMSHVIDKQQHQRALEELEEKAEADRKKLKREIRRHELELQKLQADKEKVERDLDYAARVAKIDREKAERSNYYDEISHRRKDQSEFMKFVPGIILGTISLVLTIFKIMKT